jgi:hypothetical protein
MATRVQGQAIAAPHSGVTTVGPHTIANTLSDFTPGNTVRVLLVHYSSVQTHLVSAVTINGAAATMVGRCTQSPNNLNQAELWEAVVPPGAAHTVTITYSGVGTPDGHYTTGAIVEISGAGAVRGTPVTASGNTNAPTATTDALTQVGDEITSVYVYADGGSPVHTPPSPGWTTEFSVASGAFEYGGAVWRLAGTAGAQAVTWGIGGAAQWGMLLVSHDGGGGGGGGTPDYTASVKRELVDGRPIETFTTTLRRPFAFAVVAAAIPFFALRRRVFNQEWLATNEQARRPRTFFAGTPAAVNDVLGLYQATDERPIETFTTTARRGSAAFFASASSPVVASGTGVGVGGFMVIGAGSALQRTAGVGPAALVAVGAPVAVQSAPGAALTAALGVGVGRDIQARVGVGAVACVAVGASREVCSGVGFVAGGASGIGSSLAQSTVLADGVAVGGSAFAVAAGATTQRALGVAVGSVVAAAVARMLEQQTGVMAGGSAAAAPGNGVALATAAGVGLGQTVGVADGRMTQRAPGVAAGAAVVVAIPWALQSVAGVGAAHSGAVAPGNGLTIASAPAVGALGGVAVAVGGATVAGVGLAAFAGLGLGVGTSVNLGFGNGTGVSFGYVSAIGVGRALQVIDGVAAVQLFATATTLPSVIRGLSFETVVLGDVLARSEAL